MGVVGDGERERGPGPDPDPDPGEAALPVDPHGDGKGDLGDGMGGDTTYAWV